MKKKKKRKRKKGKIDRMNENGIIIINNINNLERREKLIS